MKKNILKKIGYVIILTLAMVTLSTISEAATLSISPSNSEITIGETFTVTITAGNGAGRVDVSATNATLSSSGGFLDNDSITITVTPKATGTVTVTAKGTLSDYTLEEDQDFSKSTSVTVKEKQVTPPPQEEPDEPTPLPTTPQQPETPSTTTNTEKKSSNAYLKSITIAQEVLTPAFNKNTTDYVLTVGNNVESIQIDAQPEDSKAKVTISGNTQLVEGENSIKINVKAEDGTMKIYKITVIKASRLDMLLDKLEILGISEEKADIPIILTPEFNSETFYYTVELEENIKELEINATSVVDEAVIEITGNKDLKDGENVITITLKMPEGEDKIEYKIVANKNMIDTNNELNTNEIKEENSSWLTPELNRILSITFISIIAIAGIVFGIIEYRYTKANPKPKKENKKSEKEDEKEIEKKIERLGKHF